MSRQDSICVQRIHQDHTLWPLLNSDLILSFPWLHTQNWLDHHTLLLLLLLLAQPMLCCCIGYNLLGSKSPKSSLLLHRVVPTGVPVPAQPRRSAHIDTNRRQHGVGMVYCHQDSLHARFMVLIQISRLCDRVHRGLGRRQQFFASFC